MHEVKMGIAPDVGICVVVIVLDTAEPLEAHGDTTETEWERCLAYRTGVKVALCDTDVAKVASRFG